MSMTILQNFSPGIDTSREDTLLIVQLKITVEW
jgi:hypothetical protein